MEEGPAPLSAFSKGSLKSCLSACMPASGLGHPKLPGTGWHPPRHPLYLPLHASPRGISNTAGTLAGVIGVAATGVLLEGAGGAGVLAGWYAALAVAASLCLAGSLIFLWHARGERLFGGDATRL